MLKSILIAAVSASLLASCSTLQANGYNTTVNDVPVSQKKKEGLSPTTIGLFVVGAGLIGYMGLSSGNKNKTPQSTIDARDACRAAAQTEKEWQSC